MEVHHHPQVEKKNFKEYFLEFLMIFLAVTMGFFAESLREHIINISKEKEFVLSLKEDLVTDTTFLSNVIPENQIQFDKLDSLYTLLELAREGKPFSLNRLYYLNFRYGEGLVYFSPNTRTITQIKNTGTFSLIRNKECRDSITGYVNANEIVIPVDVQTLKEWTDDLNRMSQKIFDFKLIKTFWFTGGADIFLKDSLPLEINNDKSVLKEYANKVRSLMMLVNVLEDFEKSQLERCKALIGLLNKEYQLTD